MGCQPLGLRVAKWPEKLFYNFFFFYDFDMFLLRFCYDFIMVDFTFFLPLLKTLMISICFFYGLGASHFLLMKFVMAGPIFFVKKNDNIHFSVFLNFWKFQNLEFHFIKI